MTEESEGFEEFARRVSAQTFEKEFGHLTKDGPQISTEGTKIILHEGAGHLEIGLAAHAMMLGYDVGGDGPALAEMREMVEGAMRAEGPVLVVGKDHTRLMAGLDIVDTKMPMELFPVPFDFDGNGHVELQRSHYLDMIDSVRGLRPHPFVGDRLHKAYGQGSKSRAGAGGKLAFGKFKGSKEAKRAAKQARMRQRKR